MEPQQNESNPNNPPRGEKKPRRHRKPHRDVDQTAPDRVRRYVPKASAPASVEGSAHTSTTDAKPTAADTPQPSSSKSTRRHRTRKPATHAPDAVAAGNQPASAPAGAEVNVSASTEATPAAQRGRRRNRSSKTQKQQAAQHAAAALSSQAEVDEYCFICANPLEYYAVSDCNHVCCSLCTLRLRAKLRDRRCPVCKQEKERVIVASAQAGIKLFNDFGIWSDVGGPGIDVDLETGMMFDHCRDHFNELTLTKVPHCTICKERFPSYAALSTHLSEKHTRFMCELCVENRSIFANEQELFTEAGLKQHMRVSGRHPLCRFCNRRWFDEQQLYRHMVDAHHTCHLCPLQFQHRYYRDLRALEDHLKSAHFLCEHCNERFVSFATADEYITHLAAYHNIRGSTPTINFQVRGSHAASAHDNQGDGEAYVDMEAPRRQEGRGDQDGDESTNSQNLPRQSTWARRAGQTLSGAPQEFPSLPSALARRPVEDERLAKLREDEEKARKRRQELEFRERRVQELIESEERETSQRELLERNKRFAEALRIGRSSTDAQTADPLAPYEDELMRPVYTPELLRWAQVNIPKLQQLEKQIENLIRNPGSKNLHLPPMKAPIRVAIQALAKYYNLESIVFDPEPRRYVSLIKTPASFVPSLLLSTAAQEYSAQQTIPVPAQLDKPLLVFSRLEEGMHSGQLLARLKELHSEAKVISVRVHNAHSVLCEFPTKEDALHTYSVLQQQTPPIAPLPFHVALGFDATVIEPLPASNDQPELEANTRWSREEQQAVDDEISRREWDEFIRARGHVEPDLNEPGTVEGRFPYSAVRGRLLPRTLPVASAAEPANPVPEKVKKTARQSQSRPPAEPTLPQNVFAALENADDGSDEEDFVPADAPAGSSDHSTNDQWECTNCTCINSNFLDYCEACDAPKPEPWQFL